MDAADRQLRLANGDLLSFSDVNSAYLLPLGRGQVEPISSDTYLREQLRGRYRVKGRYVENETGQRFHPMETGQLLLDILFLDSRKEINVIAAVADTRRSSQNGREQYEQ